MKENFQTLVVVKSSLIFLYLALTIPIPLLASEELKIFSILTFVFGLFLIISITNDSVETTDEKISYQTSYVSSIFGKNSWEIYWKDIKLIKSFPTSQGSKVHYFITTRDESFLLPQRIENFEKFTLIISKKIKINKIEISYLSPLWTYSLLAYLSVAMIVGEVIMFFQFKYYQC